MEFLALCDATFDFPKTEKLAKKTNDKSLLSLCRNWVRGGRSGISTGGRDDGRG